MSTDIEVDGPKADFWNAPSEMWMGLLDKYPKGTSDGDEIERRLVRNGGFLSFVRMTSDQAFLQALLERGSVFQFLALTNPHTTSETLAQYARRYVTEDSFCPRIAFAIMSNPNVDEATAVAILTLSRKMGVMEAGVDPLFDSAAVLWGHPIVLSVMYSAWEASSRGQMTPTRILYFGTLQANPGIEIADLAFLRGRFFNHKDFRSHFADKPLHNADFGYALTHNIVDVWGNPHLTFAQLSECVDCLVQSAQAGKTTLSVDQVKLLQHRFLTDDDITLLHYVYPDDGSIRSLYERRVTDPRQEGQIRKRVMEIFSVRLSPLDVQKKYAEIEDPTQAETDFVKEKFADLLATMGGVKMRRWIDPNDPTSGVVYAPKGSTMLKDRRYMVLVQFDPDAPKPEYVTDLIPYLKDSRSSSFEIPDGVIPPLDVIFRSPFSDLLIDIYGINVLDLMGAD